MREGPERQSERWLAQAAADLYWAEHLAREGGWHLACFLAQQVTEKALKAFLYAQGLEVVLGHSVGRLCAAAARYRPEFAEKAARWSLLDSYYVPTRYPNGLPLRVIRSDRLREKTREVIPFIEEVWQVEPAPLCVGRPDRGR
jgi:HEPN domain-containing protein